MHRAFLFVSCLLFQLASSPVFSQEFNKEAWLEDFSQLKREMSLHYANLDWVIESRKINLKQLSEQTQSRLQQSVSDVESKRIFESFLNAFGDGHLYVEWVDNSRSPTSAGNTPEKVIPFCERMGYRVHNKPPRIQFTLLDNFQEIISGDSKYFPIGILNVKDNKKIGVIRISIFSELAFPDLCELAIAEMKIGNDSICNEACEEKVQLKAANLLTEALTRQVEVLKKKRIDYLLVDITGNGGGTNWIEPAARTLSSRQLNSPRQQFIRHDHWTEQLDHRLSVIQSEMHEITGPSQKLLLRAEKILRTAMQESLVQCNRDAVWDNLVPDCSLLAASPLLYPQSIFPYASPGSLPDNASAQYLFYPSRYAYREGVYTGPLIILVDQGTWSSAEYFTAMLKDNIAASIIGAPTGGAGCGYTNGGIPTILKNSGAKVKMPDCVRLRADGTNEVEGITPDILIPWRASDSPYQKSRRVSNAVIEYIDSKR